MTDELKLFTAGEKITADDTNANNQYLENLASDTTAIQAYIDSELSEINNTISTALAQTVKLSGNQTISGVKTFTNKVVVGNSTSVGAALNIGEGGITKARKGCLALGCGVKFQWMFISSAAAWNNNSYSASWKIQFTDSDTYSTVISQVNHSGSDNNIAVTSQSKSSVTVYAESAERSGGIYVIGIGY